MRYYVTAKRLKHSAFDSIGFDSRGIWCGSVARLVLRSSRFPALAAVKSLQMPLARGGAATRFSVVSLRSMLSTENLGLQLDRSFLDSREASFNQRDQQGSAALRIRTQRVSALRRW